jgi:hypothetical protein
MGGEIMLKMNRWLFFYNNVGIIIGLLTLSGCATQSVTMIQQPFEYDKYRTVQITPCVNRTDYKGTHDLATEATRTFNNKVRESGVFEIVPDAKFVLTCDIERFEEGSALKRWAMEGGATQAQVVVMVWQKPDDRLLGTFRAEASVKFGGLYTIGADHYIFGAAFNDIVKQLKSWVQANEPRGPVGSVK